MKAFKRCQCCGQIVPVNSLPEHPFAQVIERWYRQRAAGSKITLKEIAAQFDISYSTLRKYKMRYDANGGWGSKKRIKPPPLSE